MKLSDEQLVDWLITTCPVMPESARQSFLDQIKSPPDGFTRSQMRSGFKQAINDTLSDIWGYAPASDRKKMDATLAAKGLPSIFAMELALKKKHKRILKRGSIKTDEEFYIVKNILDDLESDVTPEERAELEKLSGRFEGDAR